MIRLTVNRTYGEPATGEIADLMRPDGHLTVRVWLAVRLDRRRSALYCELIASAPNPYPDGAMPFHVLDR
jgi:hypothetical protein